MTVLFIIYLIFVAIAAVPTTIVFLVTAAVKTVWFKLRFSFEKFFKEMQDGKH